MKLKEVCTETGLSRKTIRLYEEKGLLVPQKEYRNGREYREYSPEDVRKLNMIALLRRAWFTMDEIRQMMDDPDAINEIFPQYCQWLRMQKRELDGLIAVAETVTLAEVINVEDLTEKMAAAAAKLPLPKWDVHPRFKYLDEIEEATTMKREKDIYDATENTKKAYRQTALMMDQDKVNNHAITFGQIRELETGDYSSDGPVKQEVQIPKGIRLIGKIGTILVVIGFVVFAILELLTFMGASRGGYRTIESSAIYAVIMMVAGVLLWGISYAYGAYQERQRWLRVIREQEAEKQNKQG